MVWEWIDDAVSGRGDLLIGALLTLGVQQAIALRQEWRGRLLRREERRDAERSRRRASQKQVIGDLQQATAELLDVATKMLVERIQGHEVALNDAQSLRRLIGVIPRLAHQLEDEAAGSAALSLMILTVNVYLDRFALSFAGRDQIDGPYGAITNLQQTLSRYLGIQWRDLDLDDPADRELPEILRVERMVDVLLAFDPAAAIDPTIREQVVASVGP